MNLFSLEQDLRMKDPALGKVAVSSVELVDDLSKQLRTMSHLLHPPLLDEAGLASALKWYFEGFAERSNIRVDLELDSKLPRLSQEMETAIFRIVQESLTNIHRHSGSASAAIRVSHDSGKTRVEIEDTGRGIDQFDAKRNLPIKLGVGVQGMQERVRQLRGQFELQSSPRGTKVAIVLPNQ
jgi:signal transduction histidine kinase